MSGLPRQLRFYCLLALITLCSASLPRSLAATEPTAAEDAERLFTLKVLPLLKDKCFGCHGSDAENVRGGYNLLTREGMLRGGIRGPALAPGPPRPRGTSVAPSRKVSAAPGMTAPAEITRPTPMCPSFRR